ncbi:MAG: outer membrane beta-barrel family protein, partial [Bacteroidota bacterium]
MTINNWLLICTLCGLSITAFAQEVELRGQVVDAQRQPIEFANVLVTSPQNSTFQKGTITDLDGAFLVKIPANQTYSIKVSFVGFVEWQQTQTITTETDLGTIQLSSSTNELDEVVVKADRKMITRKEDKLVFNVATSPLRDGYDGLEVLQRSPNLIVDLDGTILIRDEAPTVMINGRISNLSGAALSNFISNLRSENIKSIEIQTHLSANIGGQSSGGIINIILKKQPVGVSGNARAHYTNRGGGFGDTFGSGNFNYGTEKWNVYGLLSGNNSTQESMVRTKLDYFTTKELVTTQEEHLSDNENRTAQLGVLGNVAKNHVLGIEGYLRKGDFSFENTGDIEVFEQDQSVEMGQAVVNAGTDNQLYTTTLNYQWQLDTLNSRFQFFGDYANQKVDRPNTTTSVYKNGVFSDNTERNNSLANTLIYSAQADLEKYFRNRVKLEVGAKWTLTDRENILNSDQQINGEWVPTNRSNAFQYKEKVTAGYVSANKQLLPKVFVEVGMRVENTDLERFDLTDGSIVLQNYTNWFPNLYVARELKNSQNLTFTYSKRIRRPPFQFLNNNVVKLNDFRFELGNPDLIPENVNNWEIAWTAKKQRFDVYLQRVTEAINGIYYQEGQAVYYQKFNEGIQQQLGANYNHFGNLTRWWYVNFTGRLWYRKFINGDGQSNFEQVTARVKWNNNFKINPTTTIDLIGDYISPYQDAFFVVYTRFR